MDIFAWGDTAPVTPEKRRPAPPAAAAAATAAAAPSTVPAADSYAVKRLNRYDSPAPWGVVRVRSNPLMRVRVRLLTLVAHAGGRR